MYWHLILTEKCNSNCIYCYEKSMKEFDNELEKKWKFDYSSPSEWKVDIKNLKKFIKKDKNPKIIFYGGEPLLQLRTIIEVIDEIKSKFYIQTNGKLLNEIPKVYINKFSKMLVSIDGNQERTDENRGKGNYELVIKNIKEIRKNGFKGEIVARMTITKPDIFNQVKKLDELIEEKLFDSIHWQIDAGFYKFDYKEKVFKKFVSEYKKEIKKLINYWVSEMKKGRVLKFYPFLGIFESLYYNKKTKLRCGAGHSGYAITTNGIITACPIMNCITNFYVGNLNSNPNSLKKISVIEPCTKCSYLTICGGRCLYSNHAKLWPNKGQEMICETIKFLIEELKKQIPEIKKLINKKVIFKKDFEYEKYFGPEIIP